MFWLIGTREWERIASFCATILAKTVARTQRLQLCAVAVITSCVHLCVCERMCMCIKSSKLACLGERVDLTIDREVSACI